MGAWGSSRRGWRLASCCLCAGSKCQAHVGLLPFIAGLSAGCLTGTPPLTPPPSSHVNFISGTNGSGKSAVLQALQICLGATARETGRGRSLRELIRTGCDEATLRVTVWNTGDDAYMRSTLGDWVTIERRVAKSGNPNDANGGVHSTWKLYDGRERLVKGATRKSMIDPLLEHLNIATENPLCVMTQVRLEGLWRGFGM